MRSRAAILASYSCKRSAVRAASSKASASYLATHQVAGEIVTLRQSMQRLACKELLCDLTLKLGAVDAVLGHGFHPLKARQPRSIPNLRSVHRQGRTPVAKLALAQGATWKAVKTITLRLPGLIGLRYLASIITCNSASLASRAVFTWRAAANSVA